MSELEKIDEARSRIEKLLSEVKLPHIIIKKYRVGDNFYSDGEYKFSKNDLILSSDNLSESGTKYPFLYNIVSSMEDFSDIKIYDKISERIYMSLYNDKVKFFFSDQNINEKKLLAVYDSANSLTKINSSELTNVSDDNIKSILSEVYLLNYLSREFSDYISDVQHK